MGIKIIESIPYTLTSKSNKFELLAADINEIIAKEIEVCELINFPYSDKTSLSMINIDSLFQREFYRRTGKRLDRNSVPFIMQRAKDENGTSHVYARFAVATWRKLIDEALSSKE